MNLGNRHNQHSFAKVPQANMARSSFDRSFAVKDTYQFDYLNPVFVDEILPGDTMNCNIKTFIRLAPQVVPLLDNMYVDFFCFFVPNRLVWDNWEKFNGAQENPGDDTDFVIPKASYNPAPPNYGVNTIFDKMGLPTQEDGEFTFNLLPFRMYNLIWNEWFRDQNLQDSLPVYKTNTDSGTLSDNYQLKRRGKRHDYFTSCLPWPQKGDSVTLPLGTSAPVYGPDMTEIGSGQGGLIMQGTNADTSNPFGLLLRGNTGAGLNLAGSTGQWSGYGNFVNALNLGTRDQYDVELGNPQPPFADLTDATAATINELRQAFMMQSLLELDARGGTRYTEILKAHFNVVSPDFRLQRPEYLGGGQIRINQHPVAQTSNSVTDSPQGNLAAFSTASSMDNSIGFTKSFVEHGFVITLMSARADITYQQGLNRFWSRVTRWDYFWPKLQELGEQAVLCKEILVTNSDTFNEAVFGYQERYAEYRYRPSEIRGQFRSGYAESLDVWHLAQEFVMPPGDVPFALNGDFIMSNTPIERSLVVPSPDYPHLLFDAWIDLKHARPIMTYGVPATLGRF